MRKRKVLGYSAAALLCAAAIGYVMRKSVFLLIAGALIKPPAPFDAAQAPPAPDYAKPASWAALPDKDDPSDWVPEGLPKEDNPLRDKVDVFYIHPTGYFGKTWNAAADAKLLITTETMLASQATPFNGVGKIYAPEYRQATLYSFIEGGQLPGKKDGKQALELAYSDVARAFDYFLEHFNKDRPFILVSHSQGSAHALRLIAEKIDTTDVYKRMIAAYTVGFGMPADYFERVYKNVKPCASPTQTNCLITWDTALTSKDGMPDGFHYYPTGWESAKGKKHFCVNPLTWTCDETRAPADLNVGTLLMDLELDPKKFSAKLMRGLLPGQSWAEVRDGVLCVRGLQDTPYAVAGRLGGNYHLFDFHLFWMNIRQNALARAQAYFKAHSA